MIRVAYSTEAEVAAIVADRVASGYVWISQENISEGNFLGFELASEIAERNDMALIANKVGKALFNHENRIRVLEGKAPVTMEQFKNALLNL